MLTFKTQFPVNIHRNTQDLLDCARAWIADSPHSDLAPQAAETRLADGVTLSSAGELLTCSAYSDGDTDIAGVRYEKRDDDEIRWVTDVVGCRKPDSYTVAVQLSVDSELPVERLDPGRRPYILKLIMERLGGGMDGALAVSDAPIQLREEDVTLAADLICARSGLAMPVVYASADSLGKPHIDVSQLSKWLSGMAHVVVEPSRSFSFRLMHEVFNENAYGGAVAIYWPDGIGKWTFLPGGKYSDPSEMQTSIARKVRSSLLSQRTRKDCTWSGLQEQVARKRLQTLRDSGSSDIDEYIRQFDTEISSKNEEIRRLEADLARAKYARQPHGDATSESNRTGVFLASNEKDLYQAERLDMVLDALRTAAEGAEAFSRRKDVLTDIIDQHQNTGERNEILERLKQALRQYTSMTTAIRSELDSIGFEILEEGKHYKLIYRGDERYPFILPKTGSDWRGGKNAFSDLKRRIF